MADANASCEQINIKRCMGIIIISDVSVRRVRLVVVSQMMVGMREREKRCVRLWYIKLRHGHVPRQAKLIAKRCSKTLLACQGRWGSAALEWLDGRGCVDQNAAALKRLELRSSAVAERITEPLHISWRTTTYDSLYSLGQLTVPRQKD